MLEGLVHGDPCADVPLKWIPSEVRETMARYARPAVLGEDPLAHVGSLVGPEAAHENLLRGIPQFRISEEVANHPTKMAQYHLNEVMCACFTFVFLSLSFPRFF